MLRGTSDLRRFTTAATDGNFGSVGDLYFDGRGWIVGGGFGVYSNPTVSVFLQDVPIRRTDQPAAAVHGVRRRRRITSTTFSDTLVAWRRKRMSRDAATAPMASSYRRRAGMFESARSSSRSQE